MKLVLSINASLLETYTKCAPNIMQQKKKHSTAKLMTVLKLIMRSTFFFFAQLCQQIHIIVHLSFIIQIALQAYGCSADFKYIYIQRVPLLPPINYIIKSVVGNNWQHKMAWYWHEQSTKLKRHEHTNERTTTTKKKSLRKLNKFQQAAPHHCPPNYLCMCSLKITFIGNH